MPTYPSCKSPTRSRASQPDSPGLICRNGNELRARLLDGIIAVRHQPIDEQHLEITCRVFEAARARPVRAEHRPHLDIEVGIVLRCRPDREDQMVWVALGDFPSLAPGADDFSFF